MFLSVEYFLVYWGLEGGVFFFEGLYILDVIYFLFLGVMLDGYFLYCLFFDFLLRL